MRVLSCVCRHRGRGILMLDVARRRASHRVPAVSAYHRAMPESVTLMIEPLAADAPSIGYASTFREVDDSVPALRVGEFSTQRGDGIFETIGLVDGHAQEAEPHLERLRNSARICDLPEPHLGQWRAAVEYAVAKMPGHGEYSIKLVLSRGVERGPSPTAWLMAFASADHSRTRAHGVRVALLDRGYARGTAERAPWLLLGAKTLSYAINMAAIREARRRDADDAIFTTSDGYVMEGPTSSVIVRHGDSYSTPAPSGAILHGTTQQSLFEHLQRTGRGVEYRDIEVADLERADAAWLVSSVRLATGITSVDGRPMPYSAVETAALNEYLLSPRD